MTQANAPASSAEGWIDLAKERLEAWGAEERRQRRRNGISGETLESVMVTYGHIPRASGMKKERENAEVVDTDDLVTCVAGIGRNGEQIRAALYVYYVFQTSLGAGSQIMRCNKNAFRHYLERGQERVAFGLMMRSKEARRAARKMPSATIG